MQSCGSICERPTAAAAMAAILTATTSFPSSSLNIKDHIFNSSFLRLAPRAPTKSHYRKFSMAHTNVSWGGEVRSAEISRVRVCTSHVDVDMADSRRGALRMAAVLGLCGALGIVCGNSEAVERSCEEFTVAPSGLSFCDSSLGSGVPASKGMLIKAHYTGRLENGQVFDSSYKRGKPLVFRVGVGEVIKGWDDGILGTVGIPPMLAGGKRKLKIPPELAYGERGAGCGGGSCIIPPNSILLFDVEFVGKS